MKKSKYKRVIAGLILLVNLGAAAMLAWGLVNGAKIGASFQTWKDVLQEKDYLESDEFQHEASEAIYDVLTVVSAQSRLERGGEYEPKRYIRLREYLDSRKVYDEIPVSEKGNGICYSLGDLYQWGLKGMTFSMDTLQEAYKPLFYNSIQEYANRCDEEYNVIVNQLTETVETLKKEVADYQAAKKTWSFEAVNTRYVLWDLGSGNLLTNVPQFQKEDTQQGELEAYFKGFGSYYIFDSRSANVMQQNVGDYYSYNTHALLSGWNIHLDGEYQLYVGIDTSFPVADQLAAGEKEYENVKEALSSYIRPILIGGVILLVTCIFLIALLAKHISRAAYMVLSHINTVLRICIYFAGYEFIQALCRALFGTGIFVNAALLLFKLAVLGLLVWEGLQRQKLLEGVQAMADGEGKTHIPTERLYGENRQIAQAVNDLGEGLRTALKEQMKSEQMKADLITNVSHDLKTPLTSVINYVDLMKRENIENDKAQEYLDILDQKSQRLKQLTEDLVEASRASSGNITLEIEKIDLREILMQTSGEFEERFAVKGLKLMADYPQEPLYVEADGRRLWRIIENLYRNVEKYAMPGTRVYLDVDCDGKKAAISMKNISERQLNITAEELMERFVRGDESRTTEGSGLGLAIARDLTQLQGGTFDIILDGDLFKVVVTLPCATEEGLSETDHKNQ